MIQLIYPILSFTLIMVNERIGMDGNVFELCMDISLVTWCHVQVENANDSDMSAPTMSSLALLSCTHHLRCCTQVPPTQRYCGRYLPGRADRGLGAARVVRNRPYIWPKPCLPWAQTSTRGQG